MNPFSEIISHPNFLQISEGKNHAPTQDIIAASGIPVGADNPDPVDDRDKEPRKETEHG